MNFVAHRIPEDEFVSQVAAERQKQVGRRNGDQQTLLAVVWGVISLRDLTRSNVPYDGLRRADRDEMLLIGRKLNFGRFETCHVKPRGSIGIPWLGRVKDHAIGFSSITKSDPRAVGGD